MDSRKTEKKNLVEELSAYGLTPLEATVYLCLLKYGRSTANQIAKATSIVRAEVYRVARDIAKKGIAIEQVGRPALFEAVHPDRMLETLTRQFEEKITALRQKKFALSEKLIPTIGVGVKEPSIEHFEVIRCSRYRELIEALSKIFSLANKEIDYALTSSDFQEIYRANLIGEALLAAKRGVKIKGIVEIRQENFAQINSLLRQKIIDYDDIRHANHIYTCYIIRDRKEMLFWPDAYNELPPTRLWTDSPAFINATRESFDQHWRESALIETKIKEWSDQHPIQKLTTDS